MLFITAQQKNNMSVYLEKIIILNERKEQAYLDALPPWEKTGEMYPFGLFTFRKRVGDELISRGLSELDFEKVTIIYGGNGSGKSTLLNIIASRLGLKRFAPYNESKMFAQYVAECEYRMGIDDDGDEFRVPNGSLILTSDDVFDYMLAARNKNLRIRFDDEEEDARGASVLTQKLDDNFKDWQSYTRARKATKRKWLQRIDTEGIRLQSNGETALECFEQRLCDDALICLDEPENSLSPQMQLHLKALIERKSRYHDCQFVIATHSPFVLSIENAKIYNLDTSPVSLAKWWEVDNTRAYFDFFYKNKDLFLK